ncbi:YicC/YloC family endoribonuclease [Cytophagaceae bacterium DM2B3-1]|uniref:YicC/YloC family endoribonuclease n=1 Tax=Xanthocytophaga flava TaxID=3048013 RepID=A0ABT7CI83_9BACT|nr:YicC/YloC family endoribonuclease [Xanthocytophaga flavus]MDJ1468497.1 YicC/YloC family endoribonuclease [Xanthocytophaga flavus]MDJ1493392.1 YicC/YloC family endoribonuclease [Xanthocytophaga flavus]
MLKSMTGFGLARAANTNISVSVEIRSLNSKTLDVNLRLPKNFSDKELEIRNLLNQILERGKLNVSIDIQVIGEVKPRVTVNTPLVRAYCQQLREAAIAAAVPEDDIFRLAMQLPDAYIYDTAPDENAAKDWALIQETFKQAALACDEFRIKEGNELSGKLTEYIHKISTNLNAVSTHDPERLQNIRTRIRERIAEVVSDEHFDPNRFEQELIYYIEKLDISEEKVRLKLHLDHFLEVLAKDDTPGKKLNFISQEIGREINTIGSKANDAVIQRFVVEMKDELEKIKEQSLNIL